MSGAWHAATHPLSAIKHLVHNPASAVVPKHIRDSSIYHNVVRPVVKVGTAATVGFVTGGPAGALAATATTIANGGLSNKPFQPVNNIAMPALAGYTAGQSTPGTLFNQGIKSGVSQGIPLGTTVKNSALAAFDSATGSLGGAGAAAASPAAAPAAAAPASSSVLGTVGNYAGKALTVAGMLPKKSAPPTAPPTAQPTAQPTSGIKIPGLPDPVLPTVGGLVQKGLSSVGGAVGNLLGIDPKTQALLGQYGQAAASIYEPVLRELGLTRNNAGALVNSVTGAPATKQQLQTFGSRVQQAAASPVPTAPASGGAATLANTLGQGAGAYYAAKAARDAAQIQANSAALANKTTMDMFNQNRADLAPWRSKGQTAWNQLGAESLGANAPLTRAFTTADFQADPGYQFRKSEGQKAIDHRLAAMGMNQSGQSVKEAARFNQGVADQAYQGAYSRFNADQANRFNRLNSISNTGVNAAGRVANLGANAASSVASNQVGIGNANAAGRIGSSNAYMNALNNMQQIGVNNRFNNAIGGFY